MFKKSSFVHSLDLGTTKFTLSFMDLDCRGYKKISVAAQGMRRGMLYDFKLALQAVANLIDIAEDEFGHPIEAVFLGVSGTHLEAKLTSQSLLTLGDKINHRHLSAIDKKMRSCLTKENKALIELVATKFQIDNREWIKNPIDFRASELKASYFAIFADKNYLKDLLALCNQNGLKVLGFATEAHASAYSCLSEEAKNDGCCLLDIGGGTTDGIIFIDGNPHKIFTLNIGGNLFTNDLAIGLELDFELAERQKQSLNLSCAANVSFGEQILGARARELAIMAKDEITPYKHFLKSGVYLTGGGSLLKGLSSIFTNTLGISCKETSPLANTKYLFEEKNLTSAKDATGLGLLLIAKASINKEKPKGRLSPLFSWLKELA